MIRCIYCDSKLTGKQTLFCSVKCKSSVGNKRYQTYEKQKNRGLKRKYKIFMERGGGCEICGYNKNLASIDFHHIDPTIKEMEIDLRSFGNNNLSKILEEVDKCLMICRNCHGETHYPHYDINIIRGGLK